MALCFSQGQSEHIEKLMLAPTCWKPYHGLNHATMCLENFEITALSQTDPAVFFVANRMKMLLFVERARTHTSLAISQILVFYVPASSINECLSPGGNTSLPLTS
jgi:hypothetical protein